MEACSLDLHYPKNLDLGSRQLGVRGDLIYIVPKILIWMEVLEKQLVYKLEETSSNKELLLQLGSTTKLFKLRSVPPPPPHPSLYADGMGSSGRRQLHEANTIDRRGFGTWIENRIMALSHVHGPILGVGPRRTARDCTPPSNQDTPPQSMPGSQDFFILNAF